MNIHRMRLLALAALAGTFPTPPPPRDPEPTREDIEALMNRCAAAGVDLHELHEAAGGPARFAAVAQTCLDMQAALRKLGIVTGNVERLLLHDRMVRAQEMFAERLGPIRLGAFPVDLGLQPEVQRFADYEARCAKEAALCGCGPAGVELLDRDLRGLPPPEMPRAADAFAAMRSLSVEPQLQRTLTRQIFSGPLTCACGGKGVCSEFCADELAAGRMQHPDGACALGFEGRCERCRLATWAMKREARQKQRRIDKSQVDAADDIAAANMVARMIKHRTQRAKQARRRRRGW